MPRHVKRAWEANISALWAEEVLRDRGGSLSADQLYTMLLLSGADPLKAAKARARRHLDEGRAREG